MIHPVSGHNVLSTSLDGVNRSQEQFNRAAVDVVNNFAKAANNFNNLSGSTGLSSSTLVAASAEGSADTATQMAQMISAENAFKANIKVFQTADEMQKRLIDTFA